MSMTFVLAASLLAAGVVALPATAEETTKAPARNVVLLHGATMNGAAWRGVHDILEGRGFNVSVVDLPLTSLDADVAAAKLAIDRQTGPTVLVGHSYGGAVASVAGTDPKVRSLVYVAAFQPDAGESVGELGARWPMPGHPVDLGNATMIVDPQHYAADIAADLPAKDVAFLAASQKPTAFSVFTTKLPNVAWRDKPSFGIVSLDDRTIDPALMRFMYARSGARITEIGTSHVPHMSRPDAVADVIVEAAGASRD